MGKKIKLFLSFISLCFLICAMSFGVYSAISVLYTVSGSVHYEVPYKIISSLTFSINEETQTATVTDYTGSQNILQIPATISVETIGGDSYFVEGNKYTVDTIGTNALRDGISLEQVILPDTITRIEMNAFYNCIKLSNITIPDSVEYIGQEAFGWCTSLKSITLSNSLKSIVRYTFNQCTSLSTISIPSSVTSIDWQVFNNCSSLQSINVDSANQYYSSIDGVLFNKAGTTLLVFPTGKSESYIIPDGTLTLLQYSFAYCSTLTSVSIPASVTSIYEGAFFQCSALESVSIQEGIHDIGPSAFQGCVSLKEINIPHSVKSISTNAFTNCSSLQNAYFTDASSEDAKWLISELTSSGEVIEYSQISLDDLKNPATMATYLSSIYNENFWENQTPDFEIFDISNLNFSVDGNEATVTGYTGSLTDIIIPKTISLVNGNYFGYEGDEGDYTVTSIGSKAFNSCTTLSSIFIPSSVTKIADDGVFAYCTNLTAINVDENNPSYISKDGVLITNSSLFPRIISYPAGKTESSYSISVDSIGAYAFAGNEYIKNVILTGRLGSIEEYAFEGCSNLQSVEIARNYDPWKAGSVDISSNTLKDTELIANYLTGIYCGYRWHYNGDDPDID